MNSYERFMAALECQQPDRLPIVEFVIDPRIANAICPETNSQTEFEELMDFDAVCCGAEYKKVCDNRDGSYADEWGVVHKRGTEIQDHPINGPINSEADLEGNVFAKPRAEGGTLFARLIPSTPP